MDHRARGFLVTNAIWVIEVSVNLTKKQIMGTCKYGHLWQQTVWPFGYGMYSKQQKFRISNNEFLFEFDSISKVSFRKSYLM